MSASIDRGGPPSGRWTNLLSCAALVLVALVAYHNSLRVPFLFDDLPSILDNPTIEHFGTALFPSRDSGAPVSGRPVINLSLAANHALGGNEVWGYHVVNLAIHVLAGLTLFGIVRRTLLRPALRARFGAAAQPIALMAATIWVVHPLQTEAVTYISQRAESLMGLFYFLTLYFFIRGAEATTAAENQPDHPKLATIGHSAWLDLSVGACLLGMASKEVMASAPLIILVYDRTFFAGALLGALRRRPRYYLGLAATWLLLAVLVASTESRGGTAGFGGKISVADYALTQGKAIVHYLVLSFWPHGLVFDYGTEIARGPIEVGLNVLIVLMLLAATAVALRRRPALGFLGLWFFATLAPSSSVVPISTQTMAEHRMYLPLAAVVVLVIAGLYRSLGRFVPIAGVAIVLALTASTTGRNADYQSARDLWADTVMKRPANARAHLNLGNEFSGDRQWDEAIVHYREAVRLQPNYVEAHYNLGNALSATGRPSEAIAQYGEALRLNPVLPEIHYNLANVLAAANRSAEAISHYEEAIRLQPDHDRAHFNLGNTLAAEGRLPEAIAHYETALRIKPDSAAVHENLANALTQTGKTAEGLAQFVEAIRLEPNNAGTHNNYGTALFLAGHADQAVGQYEAAVRLKPDSLEARQNLKQALEATQAAQKP